MDQSELYHLDFVAWTEQQAAALRRSPAASNILDLPNLAEEIESSGRRDVREVESLIRQIFMHLLKIVFEPSSDARLHWRIDIAAFQAEAASAFVPSISQKIDVDRLWQRTLRAFLTEYRSSAPDAARIAETAHASPVSLHELVAGDFAVTPVLGKVTARIMPQPPAA